MSRITAIMAPTPAPEMAVFVSGQPAELLFPAPICQAEILSNIAIMPEGRRRLDLEAAARAMFLVDFERRVLPFDIEATIAHANIFAACRRAGPPAAIVDLIIATVSSRTISILGSRADRRLNPLALPMRGTFARDSPVSRAIFQKGWRARRRVSACAIR